MKEQLLSLLEASGNDYVSGEGISRRLGVSRTAVWKQIHKLEQEGYQIEASRKLGYRLAAKPDKLTMTELMLRLHGGAFGRRIKLHDVVESTQNVAQRLAEEGEHEGTIVLAEQQMSGRGRLGRAWISPPGKGIWMSMILRPAIDVPYTPQLTLLTAAALCRALRRETSLDIGIKWPNDLLVDGKKISGILLESTAEDERVKYVIAGIGISVNLEKSDYTEELLEKAVSLKMAAGRSFDRSQLIAAFLKEFEELYALYMEEGFQPIRMTWEALSVSIGKRCQLFTPQGTLEGIPRGLAESGALLLEKDDGTVLSVFSAEMGTPAERS